MDTALTSAYKGVVSLVDHKGKEPARCLDLGTGVRRSSRSPLTLVRLEQDSHGARQMGLLGRCGTRAGTLLTTAALTPSATGLIEVAKRHNKPLWSMTEGCGGAKRSRRHSPRSWLAIFAILVLVRRRTG